MAQRYGFGCYPEGKPLDRDDWYKNQMRLGKWPPDAETEKTMPHIQSSGACTAGYLAGIWESPIEKINEILHHGRGSYGLIFALTGANNAKYGTDERLVEVGFQEVFQAPNFMHSGVPIKLWALDLVKWEAKQRAKDNVVKQPHAVVGR